MSIDFQFVTWLLNVCLCLNMCLSFFHFRWISFDSLIVFTSNKYIKIFKVLSSERTSVWVIAKKSKIRPQEGLMFLTTLEFSFL